MNRRKRLLLATVSSLAVAGVIGGAVAVEAQSASVTPGQQLAISVGGMGQEGESGLGGNGGGGGGGSGSSTTSGISNTSIAERYGSEAQ